MRVHKKKLSYIVGVIAMMLLLIVLFSCNNEDYLESGNPKKDYCKICFGLTSDTNTQTKGYASSYNKESTINRFVLRSDNSADTLCVRTIASDGINVSDLKGKEILTRSVPVTKENFYDKFHVLAYWSKNETPIEQFYMNEDVANKSSVWSTNQTYYWPGADHSLQFYAWAPIDANGLTTPLSPQDKSLKYIVPADATTQKDIVVATTGKVQGDNNAVVPLTFKHICTAVRFAVGTQMQPGKIKSIALKGVIDAGTYNMESETWTFTETSRDFYQELNKTTTGNEGNGDAITTSEGTFMMVPQTLPENAMVEVIFTNTLGVDRTLTASIGNMQWTMGTTVTYKLSITPEYELEFVSQPQAQDAHYVIYPITIKSDDKLPEEGWTLTSDDITNVTFVEKNKFVNNDIQSLVDMGYWLDDFKGTNSLTSTTIGEVQVYVFLKENATDTDRKITLSLKPAAQGNYEVEEFSFTQYCPAWNNGIGVERIQDKDYPWGFNWDSDMKIVYSMPSGLLSGIYHVLFDIFGDHSYIESSGWAVMGTWKVTVDFSKVPVLTTATDELDGILNTWELYNFDGISEAETIMKQLESWGGEPDKALPTNPSEFAAKACVMKNKYNIETKEENGSIVYRPVLNEQKDIVWYLPAKNEAQNMNDNIFNLSGNYWTSTAITNPGTTAYKYTAGSSTSEEERNSIIHVRAVRKKP